MKITFIIEKSFAFYQFSYKGRTRESNSTLNFLRNKYWLTEEDKALNLCYDHVTCKYINAITVTPPATPALPKFRLGYSFLYQNIGLDYTGPIYFKNCDHPEKMVHFISN